MVRALFNVDGSNNMLGNNGIYVLDNKLVIFILYCKITVLDISGLKKVTLIKSY